MLYICAKEIDYILHQHKWKFSNGLSIKKRKTFVNTTFTCLAILYFENNTLHVIEDVEEYLKVYIYVCMYISFIFIYLSIMITYCSIYVCFS